MNMNDKVLPSAFEASGYNRPPTSCLVGPITVLCRHHHIKSYLLDRRFGLIH